jgi:hypothetical protein
MASRSAVAPLMHLYRSLPGPLAHGFLEVPDIHPPHGVTFAIGVPRGHLSQLALVVVPRGFKNPDESAFQRRREPRPDPAERLNQRCGILGFLPHPQAGKQAREAGVELLGGLVHGVAVVAELSRPEFTTIDGMLRTLTFFTTKYDNEKTA